MEGDKPVKLEVDEQIKIFKEFIEQNYYPQLLESARKGNSFLVLDFAELIKFNTDLAEELLESPEELLKAGELAVKEFDLPQKILKFNLRMRGLPESQRTYISEIRSKHLEKFIWTEGIVRQKSDVRPHVTAAKFECPSCGNILTILQLDKKYKEPSRCGCGRKGKFKEISKELVDGQGLVLEESPDDLDAAQPKRINVFLKDDLVSPLSEKRCSPGSRVRVCGWVSEVPITLRTGGQSTKYDLVLDTNYIEPLQEDFSEIKINDKELEEIKKIAQFPNPLGALAQSIAPSIYGHDKVKEALVLQLAGGVRKIHTDGIITRGDMHLLLIGDPGSGKCLHPETKIVLSDGGIKTIKEVVETNLDKESIETPTAIFNITALNEKGLSEQKSVTKLWKRPSPAFLLKIKTQSGNEIIVTENHPFFVTANSIIFSKQACELTINDYIATPRKIRIENCIQPLLQNFKLSPARNKKKHIFPEICDEEIARFFGYLVGDGYVAFSQTSGWISLTNNDKSLLIDFEKILDQRFGAKAARRTSHIGKSALESYLLSIELVRWLESIEPTLLQKSAGKRIPEVINKSPNHILKEFLRALFECEGSVNCNKSAIKISSASKHLISDLKIALLRFGVVCFQACKEKYATNTTLKQRRPYYELQIYGEQAANFAREIGFMSVRKNELLLKAITKRHNTNTDIIPKVGQLLKTLRINNFLLQRELGLPRGTYLHYELGDRQPSRDSLQKVVAALKEKIQESTLALNLLEEISQADIFWDKIKYIEKIPSDIPFVYDLQVESVHNYLANSIIVHNSQLLKRISKVAPKARFTSGKGATAAGLTASVVKDEFLGGWSLEAGTLVLANHGFAIIDEMDKMGKEDRSALHEALEQQSYHYDTEIMFADGSTKKIGAFVDNLLQENQSHIILGKECEILPLTARYEVISTDFISQKRVPINRVSRHKAPSHFYQITYSNGRTIVVTPEHPVYVVGDAEIITMEARALEEGMLAPAPRFLSTLKKTSEEKEQNWGLFLGLQCSEGYSYQSTAHGYAEIGISNTSPFINLLAKEVMQSVFNKSPFIHTRSVGQNKKATKELITTKISSQQGYQLLVQRTPELLCKAPSKRIPQEVKTGSLALKQFFLGGFFLGDGFVDRERVGFATSSRLLAEDLQQVCLELGIYTYIEEEIREREYYKIIISGEESYALFLGLVHAQDPRKERIEQLYARSCSKCNNRDVLPHPYVSLLYSLLRCFNLADGYFYHHLQRKQHAHRKTCWRYIQKLEQKIQIALDTLNGDSARAIRKAWNVELKLLAKELGVCCASAYNLEKKNNEKYTQKVRQLAELKRSFVIPKMQKIHQLLAGDCRFVAIRSIEKMENTNQRWTYDITIEPNHTFISQNVVLHNTVSISKANIQATLKCETTVIAAANPKFGRFDPYDLVANQIDLPPTLINRFDLIFPIKDLPNREKDEQTADFILKLHKDPKGAVSEISTELLKKYFAYIRQKINPKITDAALEELKEYYISMRHAGTTEEGGIRSIPITARQLEALVRLSEAAAKIRLAKTVTKKDAQKAIELLDYCLHQIAKDTETGKIDIDRLGGTITATQRNAISIIKEIISTIEQQSGEKLVPLEKVIDLAKQQHIPEDKIEKVLEEMHRHGDIYEPKKGFIQRM